MQKHSTVLDQTTWGNHLNFEGYFAPPPNSPSWLTQLQQQDWQRRGIVIWDADLRIVAHLYAGYALEHLGHLQGTDAWKAKGLVIGSPVFQFSTSSAGNPSPKIGGTWLLENQMELHPDKAQVLVEFLTAQESLLKRISLHDKEDAEKPSVYQLIAAYGRKVREGKKSDKSRLQNRTSSPFSSHAATISQFIKSPRFVMPRQNRSEPGSAKANLKHSICPVSG